MGRRMRESSGSVAVRKRSERQHCNGTCPRAVLFFTLRISELLKPRRTPMASLYRMTRRVEFCETDMAGIAHFSNFYRWMEQAEHAFFRSLGLTIACDQDDGTTIGFPRVSSSCRFILPVKFEDEVDILLTVQRIGVKSLTYAIAFSIRRIPVAHGTLKTACCRFRPGESLQSIEIPESYRSKIEEFTESSGDG